MSEKFDHLLKSPPVDTKFVFGSWHRDRFRAKGYLIEAKVALRALLSAGPGSREKFLIVSRARSGTSLLRELLDSHPDINCEPEILASGRLFPKAHVAHRVKKSESKVYGAKILSYQMIQIHRIADPERFFGHFRDQGFKFIHLKRNTFWQTFSLLKAGSTGVFHSSSGKKADTSAVEIDVPNFVARLKWSDELLKYETAGLKTIPHLEIDYDSELAAPELLLTTASKVFAYLGVPDAPVESRLKKLLPSSARDLILNYDELAEAIEAAGISHVLPD